MCDNPVILNLQILKRESYISVICQAIIAVEDKKADADTHLAKARRQNTGNGISGDKKRFVTLFWIDKTKDKRSDDGDRHKTTG